MPEPDDNQQPWILVDLGQVTTITGVVTQGRGGGYCDGEKELKKEVEDTWVSQFKVAYSDDGLNDEFILDEDGDPMVSHFQI